MSELEPQEAVQKPVEHVVESEIDLVNKQNELNSKEC